MPETKCAYCGDEAFYGPLSGAGPVFCAVCAALGVQGVVPGSEAHEKLRPYFCTSCNSRTAAIGLCARPACLEARQN